MTRSCVWRGPSLTSKAPKRSSPSTSPRRWGIARSIVVSGCRLKVEIDHGDGASAGEKAYGIWTGTEARRDQRDRDIRATHQSGWDGPLARTGPVHLDPWL